MLFKTPTPVATFVTTHLKSDVNSTFQRDQQITQLIHDCGITNVIIFGFMNHRETLDVHIENVTYLQPNTHEIYTFNYLHNSNILNKTLKNIDRFYIENRFLENRFQTSHKYNFCLM